MSDKKFKFVVPGIEGGGAQVFEADTQEELNEQFAKAQENATAKIRQLAQQNEVLSQQAQANPTATPANNGNEREQFFNTLYQNPEAAIVNIIENQLGMSLGDFKQDYQEVRAGSQIATTNSVAAQFAQLHPEVLAVSREDDIHNGKAMSEILTERGWKWNVKNLEAAFAVAKSEGKIKGLDAQPQYPEATLVPSPSTITRPTGAVNTSIAEEEFLRTAPLAQVRLHLEKKYGNQP